MNKIWTKQASVLALTGAKYSFCLDGQERWSLAAFSFLYVYLYSSWWGFCTYQKYFEDLVISVASNPGPPHALFQGGGGKEGPGIHCLRMRQIFMEFRETVIFSKFSSIPRSVQRHNGGWGYVV